MDALVIERSALGGQAGVTERIDNYPGFPDGVGGAELAARMEAQARRRRAAVGSGRAVARVPLERIGFRWVT
jgi:thioredoxin reductase (NADPH)